MFQLNGIDWEEGEERYSQFMSEANRVIPCQIGSPYSTLSDFDTNWYIYSVPWKKRLCKILAPNDLWGQI